jgi:hypothetical protein
MEPGIEIEFMNEISSDIIAIKPDNDKSISDLWNEFYDVMRKYGIKQGTKSGNGILTNNFEWTMCVNLFVASITNSITLNQMMEDTPEDLRCY